MKNAFLVFAIVGLFATTAMAVSFPAGFIQNLDGDGVTPSGLWAGGTSLSMSGVSAVGSGGTTQAIEVSTPPSGQNFTVSATISTNTTSELGLIGRSTGLNGYTVTTNFYSGTFNIVKVADGDGDNLATTHTLHPEGLAWISSASTLDMTMSMSGNWLFGQLTDGVNTEKFIVNDSAYTTGQIGMLLVATDGTDGQVLNGTYSNLNVGASCILPGDANLDFTTNATDLNTVLSYYNQPGDWTKGDFDNSGTVDATDLNTVLSYYNQSVSGSLLTGSSLTSVVPEPSTICIILSGLAALVLYGLRKR